MQTADIAIVGGGLAGTAAAIATAKMGFSTLHLAPKGPEDKRTSALMGPSVDILLEHGLIGDPNGLGEPLRRIRIIDATNRLIRAPETLFDAREAGHEAFGWNFANAALLAAFKGRAEGLDTLHEIDAPLAGLTQAGDHYVLETSGGERFSTRLVAGADGKRSLVRKSVGISVREKSHGQSALVTDLDLERPLGATSVEFHYENGPFTLVRAGGTKANLVWIDKAEALEAAKALDEEGFNALMAQKSQHLFGHARRLIDPVIFPLSSLFVAEAARDGAVLVGEAAHAFPPIGAQGLNLGLRDVADLLGALDGVDPAASDWAVRVARDYGQHRAGDLKRTGTMVDALFGSLLTDFLPTQAARAAGLWALRMVPGLRAKAFSIGMGQR